MLMAARCISRFAGAVALLAGVNAADADSSSPLLAAYYDRQMAIVGGEVYAWRGDDVPRKLGIKGAQVGVGYRRFYVLTGTGNPFADQAPGRQAATVGGGHCLVCRR